MDEEALSHESSVNLFQAVKIITDEKDEHREKKGGRGGSCLSSGFTFPFKYVVFLKKEKKLQKFQAANPLPQKRAGSASLQPWAVPGCAGGCCAAPCGSPGRAVGVPARPPPPGGTPQEQVPHHLRETSQLFWSRSGNGL